jgi:cytochrome c-type biogenesis protein CcmF
LPWALFAAAALGLGIMMGAAWAYESLNFGGYWAWDPVENASLVPWLVLVGGVHTLLVYRHTGNALRSTFFFFIVSFLLVLYSTYLTRSGDLQETSVHAFTGSGMTWQLRVFLMVFVIGAFTLFFRRYKQIPHIVKEEESSSREFWMFIGSLVFFLSAVSIIIMTSIPVINKFAGLFAGEGTTLFKPLAMGEDSGLAYNRIQIFVAIILALLTAVTQYLKYKQTPPAYFMKKILYPTIASVIVAGLILWLGDIRYFESGVFYYIAICLAVICSVYTIIANASYIWLGLNGKLLMSGASVAHVGFGLMLLGILVSSSKKEIVSHNTSGIFVNFGKDSKEVPGENLTLIKGIRTDMGKYWVTYVKDSAHPEKPLWFYHLKFENKKNGETFTLTPNAFVNYKGNQGLMANPDAKHYLDHDIFTYITSLPDPEKSKEDTSKFRSETIKVGDTAFYSKGMIVLENLNTRTNIPQPGFAPEDSATIGRLKILAKTGSVYTSDVLLVSQSGVQTGYPDTVTAEGLVLQLQKLKTNEAELGIKESGAVMQYVTLKAYKFPMINLLWLGTIIMVIGLLMSMYRRIQMNFRKI